MTRTVSLALGMIVVFALTVAVLLTVMPSPHKSTDYLVIGAVGTLLCLLLLFVVLINTTTKPPQSKTGSEPPTSAS